LKGEELPLSLRAPPFVIANSLFLSLRTPPFVIASPLSLSLRAEGVAIPQKQNSKIKSQNDRAKNEKTVSMKLKADN